MKDHRKKEKNGKNKQKSIDIFKIQPYIRMTSMTIIQQLQQKQKTALILKQQPTCCPPSPANPLGKWQESYLLLLMNVCWFKSIYNVAVVVVGGSRNSTKQWQYQVASLKWRHVTNNANNFIACGQILVDKFKWFITSTSTPPASYQVIYVHSIKTKIIIPPKKETRNYKVVMDLLV